MRWSELVACCIWDELVGEPRGGDVGGGGSAIDLRIKPAIDVAVIVSDYTAGTFEVSWREQNPPGVFGKWLIRYTSADIAGDQQGNTQWRDSVLRLSRTIGGDLLSSAGNREFRIPITNKMLRDGWIMVAVETRDGLRAVLPSLPVFVSFSTGSTANPSNVTGPALTITYTGVLDGTGGSYFVTGLRPVYTPPADLTNFAGMHLTVTGYDANANPVALGPMHRFNQVPGSAQVGLFTVPPDTGQAVGTATMTNASTLVTRISGTVFAAGMVNNVFGAGNVATTVHSTIVSAFTDANNISILVAWPFTTGTYNFIVFNDMTFYFVSVGKQGQRNRTLSTHPTVVV